MSQDRSTSLTMEDQLILNWLCELQFSRYQIRGRFRWCADADRRDADIMRIGVMNPWCVMTWQQTSPIEPVLLRGPKRARRLEYGV